MNEFSKDIKEEIYKCSKCGLCRSVCPVFLALKNEMFLPRGRFIVLNNSINNSIELHKSFVDKLDVCLNCNLCKDFCPSDINSSKIFTEIKSLYSFKSGMIPFYLKLKLIFLLEKIKSFKNFNFEKANKTEKKYASKVAFFQGCYNKFVNSDDKIALISVLNNAGYDVDIISGCCGYPYLSDANIQKFKNNALKFKKYDFSSYEYVICSCDTCFDTLNKYSEYVPELSTFTGKLLRFDEFVKIKNILRPEFQNALYFKPLLRKDDFWMKSFNVKGMCSGMENFFMFKYPKIAEKIFENLGVEYKKSNEKDIVTTCLLSKWGLQKMQKKLGFCSNIYTLAEYIRNTQK